MFLSPKRQYGIKGDLEIYFQVSKGLNQRKEAKLSNCAHEQSEDVLVQGPPPPQCGGHILAKLFSMGGSV